MSISRKLLKFLEKAKVKYQPIEHKTVYTAFDKAQTLKVPEKMVGKTLVIKIDRDYAIVLIGANRILDIVKFKKLVNKERKTLKQKSAKKISFATESWIKKNLKGVKVGAIPPFGNLWGLPTFVEKSLINQSKIIINGGDYDSSIKINSSSLKKLIPELIIGNFGKAKR